LFYYLLAGFNLLTILATLSLSNRIVALYVSTVSTSRDYDDTLGRLSELDQHVRGIDTAARTAFVSGKQEIEAERMRSARDMLDTGLERVRRELQRDARTEKETRLNAVETSLNAYARHAEGLLDQSAGGRFVGALRAFAAHQRHRDAALHELELLCEHVRTGKQAVMDEQLATARFLEQCQYVVLGCVALMVICVTVFGLGQTKSFTKADREREGYLKWLALSEGRARGVLAASLDAVVVIDHAGRITEFNPAAERTFGCSAAATVGESLVDKLLSPKDRQEVQQALVQYTAATPGGYQLVGCRKEVTAQRADGVMFPAELAVTAIQHDGPTMFAASFRDLTESRRLARRQELQHAVTRILAEMSTFAEAGPLILEILCAYLEWEIGVLWVADEYTGVQRCRCLWRREESQVSVPAGACGSISFPPGEGLVGKTYATCEPCWLCDVEAAGEFPALLGHRLATVGSAFCFPILVGDKVMGTLEFFSSRKLSPDENLMRLAASLGIQIGQFIERERTMARLRESDERFQIVSRATNDAVYDWDLVGKTIWWNEAVSTIFGYRLEEVNPSESWWADRIHPSERDRVLADMREQINRGANNWSGEYRFRRADGTYATILDRGYVVYDGQGQAVRMIGAMLDITHRKEAETELLRYTQEVIAARDRIEKQASELAAQAEQLRLAQARAEQASRLKSQFLANMSHEIRTPMNGILGMTELALNTPLSAEQREYLETVKTAGDTLLSLLNDILDFSKIEAGKMDLDPVDLPLRDTLVNALRPLGLRAHAKGLELACHVHQNVPDWLVGDPVRLQQVITNLVGNAIKFTERGEVVVSVSVDKEVPPRRPGGSGLLVPPPSLGKEITLRVSIRDTGIGIAPEKLSMIFEPFTQEDGSTTRRYGGTGLGLSICKKLVELMGGQIWVESQQGCGSTFTFTVRMAIARNSKSRVVPREPACLHGRPVLVIDDNETNRFILQEMLSSWGLKPVAAASGHDGLAELEQAAASGRPYPLVLVDGVMPEMDGLEVVRRIKSEPALASAAVLLLTSGEPLARSVVQHANSVAACLIKPIRPAELLSAILEAVGAEAPPRPVSLAADAPSPSAGSTAGPTDGPANGLSLRVLLAEDNCVNQKLTMRLLEKRGHVVRLANNGQEAINLLNKERFDVVLMDVQMPVMGGFEATEQIRSQERHTGQHVPIIALTANAMKGDRERCLAAGFDDYVSKPIQVNQLFDAIQAVVGAHPGGSRPRTSSTVPAEILDLNQALERAGGDVAFLHELVELFLEDGQKLFDQVRQAVLRGDAERLAQAAHTLKGCSANLGASVVAAAARELQKLGEANDFCHAGEALHELGVAMENLRKVLHAWLEENAVLTASRR